MHYVLTPWPTGLTAKGGMEVCDLDAANLIS